MTALELVNSSMLVLVLFVLQDVRSRLTRIEGLHMKGCKKEDKP